MIGKMMMTAAFAVATLTAPAIAQTSGSGSMGSGSMGTQSGSQTGTMSTDGSMGTQTGTMASDGSMDHGAMNHGAMAPHMTRAQMASMKRCQAMTPARMARNSACMRMQRAHPDMMTPAAM